MSTVCIVGSGGYVGLTYAVALADRNHDVIGLDLDAVKIASLNEGRAPIFEPGLDNLLRRGLDSGRLRFTTDASDAVAAAGVVFICVGTPPDSSGRAELGFVLSAARSIAQHARGHTIVVNKSTLPVGSVQRVVEMLSEHGHPDASFSVVSNPEFLREGTALDDVFYPDRIVLGADDHWAAQQVANLYATWTAPIVFTDPRSAEMIKYASNAFLATKISFINEVALICERLGADVLTVARGMGLDDRIGARYLGAGAGFGGSCFPKDVRALAAMARDSGADTELLDAVLRINAAARLHVVRKVLHELGDAQGKRVAILGLTFKPDTDDTRESPAIDVIAELVAAGITVRATDPMVSSRSIPQLSSIDVVPDAYSAAMGCDVVVVMTEWAEYLALDFDRLANAMRGRLVVDARNALSPTLVEAAGLRYTGIGRPSSSLITPLAPPATVLGETSVAAD